jgi:hypothetical protein
MEKQRNLREGIEDADATGLVAGEELITNAETMLPLARQRAALPREHLHAALPHGHSAHGTIDALHAEMESASPNRDAVERHVAHLRGLPEVEAIIVNWWENPHTQRFFEILGQIGV